MTPQVPALTSPVADLSLTALLDSMLDGLAIYRAVRRDGVVVDFRRVYLNAAGKRALPGADVQAGEPLLSVTRPGAWPSGLFDRYRAVVDTGVPWTGLDVAYRDEDFDAVFTIQAWHLDGADGFAVTWRDVSAETRAHEALQASEERFRATVEQLPDAVSVFTAVRDPDGVIVDFRWVYANEHNARMTGYSQDHLIGRDLLEVFPEQRAAGMIDVYTRVVETGEPYEQPTVWYEDTWGDGTRRRRAFDVRASKVNDGFVVVTRDVTDLRTATEELQVTEARLRRAHDEVATLNAALQDRVLRDPLTHLYNRRYLEQRLVTELAQPDRPVSVLQVDVDHFKAINDRYGHDVGDAVLKRLADLLRATFRGADVACRYGGEEFTVVLPSCDSATAAARAEELRAALRLDRRPSPVAGGLPTLSIGVATGGSGQQPADLIRAADQALLLAKAGGRDRTVLAAGRPATAG